MNKNIFYKEELDYILDNYKKGAKLNVIGKELKRTGIQVKKELCGYIKELHHNGSPIYTLSKEYKLSLENIKEIIDTTKLSDQTYLTRKDVVTIAEHLKSKKKYCEIAKMMNASKDTIQLYHKRYIQDNSTEKVVPEKDDKTSDNNNVKKPGKPKKKSKLEVLEEENKMLRQELDILKKKLILANI